MASFGGAGMVLPVHVASRREFTGSWEYLVEDAIFTSPPHPAWSGAALINREGKLVGVGSLIVGDANGENEASPGNMFVPIDLLAPILGDLLAKGRIAGAGRPWLGVNAQAMHGRLLVGRVAPGGPAEKAGLKRGDIIAGVNGEKTRTLSELYRKVWALGAAGVTVPLDVLSDSDAAPRRGEVGQPARHAQAAIDVLRELHGLHALQRAAIDLQSAGALRAQCQGPAVRGAQARSARRRPAQAGVSRAQSQRRGADAEHDGNVVIDSSVIIEYLDEVVPETAHFTPRDPVKRAAMRR